MNQLGKLTRRGASERRKWVWATHVDEVYRDPMPWLSRRRPRALSDNVLIMGQKTEAS